MTILIAFFGMVLPMIGYILIEAYMDRKLG